MSGTSEAVEVVVVGAGAAGSLFAAKLAQAGRKVLVLDAGPDWTIGDLKSSQIWARRLKWGGPPVTSAAPTGHGISFGWGMGGAALHHYASWPRPTADTFRLRTLYGHDLDWPVTYEQLRPYYDRIQDEIGISGDAAAEPWRPPGAAYPMPPLRTFKGGEVLRKGFEAVGLPVAPLPAAINTVWRNNRAPCLYDGWCDAGCPIGSLANPLVTHIPAAQEAGAEFRARAIVTRIETDARGRATGVSYLDVKGERRFVAAEVVVLASSVMQNPRLMLASTGPRHPRGISNGNDLVGRYLSIEPGAHVFGLFGEETEPHMGVNAGQLMHRKAHRDGSARPDGGYQWQIAPAMKPNDIFGVAFTRQDLFGKALDTFIRRAAKHTASLAGFAAGEADPANRVLLGSRADAWGLPQVEVRHRPGERSTTLWKHMIAEGLTVMRRAGATEAWNAPMDAGHVTGGTIMGTDPSNSVTDSYGRAWEAPNVVVAGAGLFPTNGGTSPTYTLYAAGLRSVERLIGAWKEYAAA